MNTRIIITGLTFLALVVPNSGYGQLVDTRKIDDSVLVSLYELQIKKPDDSFLQKRIQEERENVRNTVELELSTLITIPADEEVIDSSGELTKALDRQKNTIEALQERLRERKIDLDLLGAEEEKFYKQKTETGAIASFKTTTSHPHLLAKKAILEERILVLQILIPHQQERLNRLLQEQRTQQFGSLTTVGTYLLVILLIWLFERVVRQFLLVRIKNRSVRYTSIKFFSGTVYTLAAIWLGGVLYAKNPNILASFAIVGAGIAIALQDVIKDTVGWIIIHQSNLYSQGDRITIGRHTGEVVDLSALHTKLLEIGLPPEGVLEQTGKVLSIPNGKVLTESVTNYNLTSDYVKAEMKFAITFESNWKKAEEILQTVLAEETMQFADRDKLQHNMRTRTMYIPHEPSNPLVYKDIATDGVEFLLRFAVPIGGRRTTVSTISGRVLEEFGKHEDINLAYTTSRILAEVIPFSN